MLDMRSLRRFEAARLLEEASDRSSLSHSDCEPCDVRTILSLADGEFRAEWYDASLGYQPSSGTIRLRDAIAGGYASLDPDSVLPCAPVEGVLLALHSLLNGGEHVVVTAPGYQPLSEVAHAAGCRVSHWLPREEVGWRFALDDLENLLRSDTRLVVVNFPHNPTGALPTPAEFGNLVAMLQDRGIRLFSDEVFRGLELDEKLPSAVELDDRAVVLSGVSKTYGLGGLRVGWLATGDHDFLRRAEELKDYTTSSVAGPSQLLASMALRGGATLLQRNRERIAENAQLLEELASVGGVLEYRIHRGGTTGFPRVCKGDAEGYAHRVHERCGLTVLTSCPLGHGNSHVRIGLGRVGFPRCLDDLREHGLL